MDRRPWASSFDVSSNDTLRVVAAFFCVVGVAWCCLVGWWRGFNLRLAVVVLVRPSYVSPKLVSNLSLARGGAMAESDSHYVHDDALVAVSAQRGIDD